jgi:hypothetical protein
MSMRTVQMAIEPSQLLDMLHGAIQRSASRGLPRVV